MSTCAHGQDPDQSVSGWARGAREACSAQHHSSACLTSSSPRALADLLATEAPATSLRRSLFLAENEKLEEGPSLLSPKREGLSGRSWCVVRGWCRRGNKPGEAFGCKLLSGRQFNLQARKHGTFNVQRPACCHGPI